MANGLEIAGVAVAAGLGLGLAAGGVAYASVWPTSGIFGAALSALRNPVGAMPEIALTFDDGPNQRWTPPLLELLAKHEIRATFFLIGEFAAAQRSLARQTHEAGHLIGNHTWTHPNLFRTGGAKTRQELMRTSDELQQILGAPVRFFRPPFGLRGPATFRIARELGLIPVTWNVIGNDWKAENAQQITERVLRGVARNDEAGNATNLVLHDGSHRTPEADRSRTVASVGELLPQLVAGRRFVTLDAWVK